MFSALHSQHTLKGDPAAIAQRLAEIAETAGCIHRSPERGHHAARGWGAVSKFGVCLCSWFVSVLPSLPLYIAFSLTFLALASSLKKTVMVVTLARLLVSAGNIDNIGNFVIVIDLRVCDMLPSLCGKLSKHTQHAAC